MGLVCHPIYPALCPRASDRTVEIIKIIRSSKIKFSSHLISHPAELTKLRNRQIAQTKTDWLWLVDGDEVYTKVGAREIVQASTPNRRGIAVRRYDLLGDIYHRQRETVGEYRLLGTRGHLVTRLINRAHFPGLHVERDYPLEAYLDGQGRVVHSYKQQDWYLTTNHLHHAMYLRRSSLGGNLPMFNRGKFKIETGLPVPGPIPEVFALPRPPSVPDPLVRRSFIYELFASITTPIKNFKRLLLP